VAAKVYEQIEQGEVVPARIIGLFQEVEEQNQVASMFQTGFGSELGDEEKQKAITDLVIKIKEHSLEQQAGQITDLKQLQELVQQKKALQNAVKLHIS
jgi:DNA primase